MQLLDCEHHLPLHLLGICSAAQANIARLIPEYAVEPVKDHQMRQTQVVHLTVTIRTLGGCKFTQCHIHSTLTKILIKFIPCLSGLLPIMLSGESTHRCRVSRR